MTLKTLLKKKGIYIIMLSIALWLGCSPSPSFALPVGSYEEIRRYEDRENIDSFLAEELVLQKLAEMGLSKSEVDSRLDTMSEAQLHTLAVRLDRLKSGSSGAAVAIAIVMIIMGMVLFLLTHEVHIEPKESQ